MRKLLTLFLPVAILLLMFGCEKSNEPNMNESPTPYMTINIGDLRQYYTAEDDLHFEWEAIGKTTRSDGKEVYEFEYLVYTPIGLFIGKGYHFINDGFFWETNLDTVYEPYLNQKNPFVESKIIKIYPEGDEYFLRTAGVPRDQEVHHKINLLDSLTSPLKLFADVQECEVIYSDRDNKLLLYYAKKWGHVGTKNIDQNGTSEVMATFIKVGSDSIGVYQPLSDSNAVPLNKNQRQRIFNSLFPSVELISAN